MRQGFCHRTQRQSDGRCSRTFSWDLANRLRTTTLAGTTITYNLAGDGRRTQATTGGGAGETTNTLWDVNNALPQLAVERDGSGSLLRRYTYGAGRIAFTTPSATFYYHYDDMRSATNLTDANGAKQWTYSYEPYGSARTETQDNGGAPVNPLRFAGGQLDPTGLYHLRARQYDPAAGRFSSTDPVLGEPRVNAVSAYAYVDGRPTVLVDPSGLTGCLVEDIPVVDWIACPSSGERQARTLLKDTAQSVIEAGRTFGSGIATPRGGVLFVVGTVTIGAGLGVGAAGVTLAGACTVEAPFFAIDRIAVGMGMAGGGVSAAGWARRSMFVYTKRGRGVK